MTARARLLSLAPLIAVAVASFLVAGCASVPPKKAPAEMKPGGKKGELPKEIGVTLRLEPGNSWKSRFVSTGEVKRSYRGADGKVHDRNRTVGIEITAVQKVVSVDGSTARVEVSETSTRILQDGKFVEAPFTKFAPPNPGYFTVDMVTGKSDFSEIRKGWGAWMEGLKDTPPGGIIGKTFRVDSYVAQLEDLYAKPFNRLSGRRLSKEMKAGEQKAQVLPFVGPSAALAPVAVISSAAWEGFERRDGLHLLKVVGRYEGKGEWSREDADARLSEFGIALPQEYRSEVDVVGQFHSSVDVLAGREITSESALTYRGSMSFGAELLTEEITAKHMMDPAE